jgi:hypothetical protein
MEQADADIAYVRQWCKALHVDDPGALDALNDGRGIFDVSTHGDKLDSFALKHGLQTQIRRGHVSGLVGHRQIHLAFKIKPN